MADNAELEAIIANGREAVIIAVNKDGYPQPSNVRYRWYPEEGLARVTTTDTRLKTKQLRRDPRCALYVPGKHDFQFAVLEADAEISAVATTPGDDACRELLGLYTDLLGDRGDEDAFFASMIEHERLVIRLRPKRIYGLYVEKGPGS